VTSIVDALTHLDVAKIVRLVETLHQSTVQFIRIEADGVEITVTKGGTTKADTRVAPSDASNPPPGVPVVSPHVGVFRSDAAGGVRVGSRVDASSVLGSIQTLDETNPVKAGISGDIIEACVREGDFVEFGQPLYRILPASGP
jgi:acetyl-CoA carboxylase biotin carboxyl carrier protein